MCFFFCPGVSKCRHSGLELITATYVSPRARRSIDAVHAHARGSAPSHLVAPGPVHRDTIQSQPLRSVIRLLSQQPRRRWTQRYAYPARLTTIGVDLAGILRGIICTSVPLLQILGGLVPHVPRDLRPCSPHTHTHKRFNKRT